MKIISIRVDFDEDLEKAMQKEKDKTHYEISLSEFIRSAVREKVHRILNHS